MKVLKSIGVFLATLCVFYMCIATFAGVNPLNWPIVQGGITSVIAVIFSAVIAGNS